MQSCKKEVSIDRSKTVGISGYYYEKLITTYSRQIPEKRKWYQCFKEEIVPPEYFETLALVEQFAEELIHKKYDTFLCGLNDGFALLAAKAILNLKNQYANIRLIIVSPYKKIHIRNQKKLKKEVFRKCDSILTMPFSAGEIVEGYYAGIDHILHNSCVVLCYFDGNGGETSILMNRANKHIIYNVCKTSNALRYGHFNWKGELNEKKNRINHGK